MCVIVFVRVLYCVASMSVSLIKTHSSVGRHLVIMGKWACGYEGKRLGKLKKKTMEEAEGKQDETQGDTAIYFRTKGLLI